MAKALAEIKEASPDVTPAELNRRAANYRTHYEGAALTANALAKHWIICKDTPAKPTKTIYENQNGVTVAVEVPI